ncbi:uncharacterized protein A4U43_C03F26280 [Asparagus officinalis]|uniref:Uncharacterized protein n=1 Tax=Asparagus officinalis TaxID=4686 RepID=A0A5P1FDX8_ASPOF|nr:uncharacterized protein A4U43_C03F26280 [Asparagus officinalis]
MKMQFKFTNIKTRVNSKASVFILLRHFLRATFALFSLEQNRNVKSNIYCYDLTCDTTLRLILSATDPLPSHPSDAAAPVPVPVFHADHAARHIRVIVTGRRLTDLRPPVIPHRETIHHHRRHRGPHRHETRNTGNPSTARLRGRGREPLEGVGRMWIIPGEDYAGGGGLDDEECVGLGVGGRGCAWLRMGMRTPRRRGGRGWRAMAPSFKARVWRVSAGIGGSGCIGSEEEEEGRGRERRRREMGRM